MPRTKRKAMRILGRMLLVGWLSFRCSIVNLNAGNRENLGKNVFSIARFPDVPFFLLPGFLLKNDRSRFKKKAMNPGNQKAGLTPSRRLFQISRHDPDRPQFPTP